MVLLQRDEDEEHDYAWCRVRFDDGTEWDLPAGFFLRVGQQVAPPEE